MKALRFVLDWLDDKTQVVVAMVVLFVVAMYSDLDPAKEKIAGMIVSGLFGVVTGVTISKLNGHGKTGDSEKPPVNPD